MISQDINKKVVNSYRIGQQNRKLNKLIKDLESTGMWCINNASLTRDYIRLGSHFDGYLSGRYVIEIKPLSRRVKGYSSHISVVYTPYNRDVKWVGYVNTLDEVQSILRSINPELINTNRILKS